MDGRRVVSRFARYGRARCETPPQEDDKKKHSEGTGKENVKRPPRKSEKGRQSRNVSSFWSSFFRTFPEGKKQKRRRTGGEKKWPQIYPESICAARKTSPWKGRISEIRNVVRRCKVSPGPNLRQKEILGWKEEKSTAMSAINPLFSDILLSVTAE